MQEVEKQNLRGKRTARQLVWLILIVLLLTAAGSHSVLNLLGIRENPIRRWTVGAEQPGRPVLMLGSSLAYFGLSLSNVSTQMKQPLECRWVSSASACEMEILSREVPEARNTIICLSLYEQNERILCDYRSEIVPLSQTAGDLWNSSLEWPFAKRILAQYPLKYVRVVFPTAGRSLLVMFATKARLMGLIQGTYLPAKITEVDFNDASPGSITNWTAPHLMDQVTVIRNLSQGIHQFDGPKRRAFHRLVADASRRGRVTVIVFPVAPEYRRELVSKEALAQFEQSLTSVRNAAPRARWLRLDQLPELDDSSCYRDLAHMNPKGRIIATEAVRQALEASPQ